jgi:small conductance mechanosensitive channel
MMGIKITLARLAIILMISFTVTISNNQSIAQQSSDIPADKAPDEELTIEQDGKRANDLIRKLKIQVDAEERYLKQLKTASEEDRLVLSLQLASLRHDSIDDVLQLTDLLLKLEKKSPQPDLRNQVEELFGHILPRLEHGVNLLRGEIDRSRALRSEAKPDQFYSIELNVAKYTSRLDEVYDTNLRFINKMEQLGMNTEQAKVDLIKSFYDRANELTGRLALTLLRIDELEVQKKEFPDEAAIAKQLAASKRNLTTNTTSLEKTLNLMDKLKLDTHDFQDDLVAATRDYTAGLKSTAVAIKLAGQTLRKIGISLFENGPKYLFKALVFIGIIFIFRLIARIVRSGLKRALDKSKLDLSRLAHRMIVNTASNLIMFLGVLVALSQFGFRLGPLLAGLGVAGFIVGFALQDTLGNFASGVMILLYRPYDVGNLIEAGGVFGKVHDMSLVSTSLKTLDNQLLVIPNNKIWGDVIKNVTAQKKRRVDMVFGISYTDDIPKAERVLEDILQSHASVLDEPEPLVRVHTLGDSSVDFAVRPWVKAKDYWDVYWDVTRAVKLRFDEEGISIPFPQQDVHIHNIPKISLSAINTNKPIES